MICFQFCLVQGFAGKKNGIMSSLKTTMPSLALLWPLLSHNSQGDSEPSKFQQGEFFGATKHSSSWCHPLKKLTCAALPFPYRIQTPILKLGSRMLPCYFPWRKKIGKPPNGRLTKGLLVAWIFKHQRPQVQLGGGTGKLKKWSDKKPL